MNALLNHPRIAGAAAPVILIYFIAEWLLPSAMPVAFVLTGLAVAVTAAAVGAQRLIAGTPATLLAVAGIALAFAGIISDHATRTSLDSAFKVLGAAGVFLIGTGTKLPAPLRMLFAGTGLTALVGYLLSVSGHASSMDTVATGMLAIYPVLVSVLVLGWVRPNVRTPIDAADEVTV
jgi:hypothetical protein